MTEGERLFTAYLCDRGVPFEFEPPWSEVFGLPVRDNPDFLVEPDGVRAVIEVKQFETTRLRDRAANRRGTVTLGPAEVFGPLRRQMTQPAREQLLDFADIGVPLVIVLTNPLGADVELDYFHVAHAMLGNPKQVGLVGREGVVGSGFEVAEDYVAFISSAPGSPAGIVNHHPHVSAVVVIHERTLAADWRESILAQQPTLPTRKTHEQRVADMARLYDVLDRAGPAPEGTYRWASVYDLSANPTPPGFKGAPLPRRLFAGGPTSGSASARTTSGHSPPPDSRGRASVRPVGGTRRRANG